MVSKKIIVGILFGGKSAEHKISLISAQNVISALDKKKYHAVLIAIDKKGKWYKCDASQYLLNPDDPQKIKLLESKNELALVPGKGSQQLFDLKNQEYLHIDVFFPVLHGPGGEDGSLQGALKILGVPFVGSSVLGSAVCMDKDFSKRLFLQAGIPVAKYLVCYDEKIKFLEVKKELGEVVFVKPANMGSSVGVKRVTNEQEFIEALKVAFKYDKKVIVEEMISGRELEIALLGNKDLRVSSAVGEIEPQDSFYSYEAKYLDEKGAKLIAPAKVSEKIYQQMKTLAIKAFKVLECEGLGRCDFFLRSDGQLFLNEINSLPGFTKISMYPKLWGYSDLECSHLVDHLISLAFERQEKDTKLL